jgi:hypothetical protein
MYCPCELWKNLQLDGVVGAVGDSNDREPVAETSALGHAHIHPAFELPVFRDHQVIGGLSLPQALVDDLDLLHQEVMFSRHG